VVTTSFDDIDLNATFGPRPLRIDDQRLDDLLQGYDQWFECFAIGAPQGPRMVPPVSLMNDLTSLCPYKFKGVAAGTAHTLLAPIYADREYLCELRAVEKYIKREKEYVWFEAVVKDAFNNVCYRYKWLQVLSYLTGVRRDKIVVRDISNSDPRDLNEFPYEPPPRAARNPAEWVRASDSPPSDVGYARSSAKLGSDLIPESVQFHWRRARDYGEYFHVRIGGRPAALAAYSVHTNNQAARDIGLPAGNISAANLDGFSHRMMLRAFGTAWLSSGNMECRFLKPVGLEDFFTVKGTLRTRELDPGGVRLGYEIWGENQRGERVVAGKASAIAPDSAVPSENHHR
jgi:hypothetical protein